MNNIHYNFFEIEKTHSVYVSGDEKSIMQEFQ